MVPTLVIHGETAAEDLVLNESLPICEYLEEAYPDRPCKKLIPGDAVNKYKVRMLCEIINSGT